MLILGNRFAYEYFITKGKGESDADSKFLPYETGSYDAALYEAQEELFMNSHIKCALDQPFLFDAFGSTFSI